MTTGAAALHGGHHSAVTSISTGSGDFKTSVAKLKPFTSRGWDILTRATQATKRYAAPRFFPAPLRCSPQLLFQRRRQGDPQPTEACPHRARGHVELGANLGGAEVLELREQQD